MTIVDKEGFENVTQIALESYEGYLRRAFELHGFAGVIDLSERFAIAAKQYGYGHGTPLDEVAAGVLAKLFPKLDRELYDR